MLWPKPWFPTGMPRHTRVAQADARGAAHLYNSLIFIPIRPSTGAAKYLHNLVVWIAENQKKVGKRWPKRYNCWCQFHRIRFFAKITLHFSDILTGTQGLTVAKAFEVNEHGLPVNWVLRRLLFPSTSLSRDLSIRELWIQELLESREVR